MINPYALARNPNAGGLYVADGGNHRVVYYPINASNASVVAGFNGNGTNTNQLNTPRGLYFDTLSNSLVIINHASTNVVRWTLGASNWTLIADNINVNANLSMSQPADVTFDPMGNMYIADRSHHRILMFPFGGQNRKNIAGVYSVSGPNSTLLNNPWSVELDPQLNLYVADSGNHRIQKFLRY